MNVTWRHSCVNYPQYLHSYSPIEHLHTPTYFCLCPCSWPPWIPDIFSCPQSNHLLPFSKLWRGEISFTQDIGLGLCSDKHKWSIPDFFERSTRNSFDIVSLGMLASLYTMSPIKTLCDHVLYLRETLICRPYVISGRVPAFYAWGPRSSTEHFGIVEITKDPTSEPPSFPSSLFFFFSPLVTKGIHTLKQHRFCMQPKYTHRLCSLLCSKTAVLKSPLHFLRVLVTWRHTSHLRAEINGLSYVG